MAKKKIDHHKLAHRHLRKVDPVMAKVIKRIGELPIPKLSKNDPYRALCRAIAHQQLHGKAAETILGRFTAMFAGCEFPTPEQILSAEPSAIRACGFSEAKVRSLRDIAEKTLSGVVPTAKEARKLSNDELIVRLTEIRGVGRWTVEMFLISNLARLDILPVDDFGVRNGFRLAYGKRKMPTTKQLAQFGQRWQPYATLASLYLWRAADAATAAKKAAKKSRKKVL